MTRTNRAYRCGRNLWRMKKNDKNEVNRKKNEGRSGTWRYYEKIKRSYEIDSWGSPCSHSIALGLGHFRSSSMLSSSSSSCSALVTPFFSSFIFVDESSLFRKNTLILGRARRVWEEGAWILVAGHFDWGGLSDDHIGWLTICLKLIILISWSWYLTINDF